MEKDVMTCPVCGHTVQKIDGKYKCEWCGHQSPSYTEPEPKPELELIAEPEPEPEPKPELKPDPGEDRESGVWTIAGLFLIAAVLIVALYAHIAPNPPEQIGLRYVKGVEVSALSLEGHAPESLARKGDVIYFTENGDLFYWKNGEVSQIPLGDEKADIVHVWEDEEAYVLTRPRMDENRARTDEDRAYAYTILRIRGETQVDDHFLSRPFNAGDGYVLTSMTDFAVSSNKNRLWYILREQEIPLEDQAEYTLYTCLYNGDSRCYEVDKAEPVADFQAGVTVENTPHMVFDDAGNLYISGPEDALIKVVEKDTDKLVVFAGKTAAAGVESQTGEEPVTGEHARNDFGAPSFFYPTALAADDAYLYVVDEGTVRRIPLNGVPPQGIETVAGNVAEDEQVVSQISNNPTPGKDVILKTDNRSDMIISRDGSLFLSLPAQGVICQIRIP